MINLTTPKAATISPNVLGFMSRKAGPAYTYTVRGNSPVGNGTLAHATDEDEAEYIFSKMKKEEGFIGLSVKANGQ